MVSIRCVAQVKDKNPLNERKDKIEVLMDHFKEFERESKTKRYSQASGTGRDAGVQPSTAWHALGFEAQRPCAWFWMLGQWSVCSWPLWGCHDPADQRAQHCLFH